jgi:hypothetical protein
MQGTPCLRKFSLMKDRPAKVGKKDIYHVVRSLSVVPSHSALYTAEGNPVRSSPTRKITSDSLNKKNYKKESRANAIINHTPTTGVAGAGTPHHLLLARSVAACADGGGGARGAELRLHPEAGALQLQPQHPPRVPQAGQAPHPAHQGPDHRYAARRPHCPRLVAP